VDDSAIDRVALPGRAPILQGRMLRVGNKLCYGGSSTTCSSQEREPPLPVAADTVVAAVVHTLVARIPALALHMDTSKSTDKNMNTDRKPCKRS